MPFFEIDEILLLDQKIIKLNFKKRRLKEMEIFTIMDLDLLADYKSLVNWKGRVEQSVIEGKKYILKLEPKSPLGGYLFDTPCIMKFRFLEDYVKMKKLNETIGKIYYKMHNERQPFYKNYETVKDFVNELYSEMLDLEEFVKECNFVKVDYDDGRLFLTKFFATSTFLSEAEEKFHIFYRFLKYLKKNM